MMIRSTRWLGTLLLLTYVAMIDGLGVLRAAPPSDRTVRDRAGFFPSRQFSPIKGTVVGILASDVQAVMAREGRLGPPDAMAFASGDGSYRWLYLVTPTKPQIGGLYVPVGDNGKTLKRFDSLSMATPQTVKRWNVKAPFSLVEVEVNGGFGSPPGESFVATKMRVLDGTPYFPAKVTEIIDEVRKQYWARTKQQQPRMDLLLSEVQTDVLKDRKPTGPRETAELMQVTWLPETERLRIKLQTRITDGDYKYFTFPVPSNNVSGARQLPARYDIPPQEGKRVRYGLQFGVEAGMTFDVTKHGAIDTMRILPVQSFTKKLPKPALPPQMRGSDKQQ